ncbi:MAG: quinone-dependent dihydroorotate dehydrogenase [Bacteroidetes bacterium]|nr:quinone-dependent dihydroorotate dehydrogenase [Bacteroidota bacterium]
MSFYTSIIRPVLFRFAPETVHHFTFSFLRIAFKIPLVRSIVSSTYSSDKSISRKLMGIDFPNPIGLAAGFDKDAKLYSELSALGFGFIEVGTITPKPQPGNDKPRLFRLPKDSAIINRMGFNNHGVEQMVINLKKNNSRVIIGGNIGKNKNTPNENAVKDYIICFESLFNVVDYFVVNVSSPNTPGLRALQEKEPLLKILNALQILNNQLAIEYSKKRKPVLLKIAPDLTNEQLDEIVEVLHASGLDGVIATNTTISRENLNSDAQEIARIGAGGLSGKPLAKRSTEVIKYLAERSDKKFIIIGVGGIHSETDAIEKLNAGADLIQLYTGFIYEGPALIQRIKKRLKVLN